MPENAEFWANELSQHLPDDIGPATILLAQLLATPPERLDHLCPILTILTELAPAHWLDEACDWAERLVGALSEEKKASHTAYQAPIARLHARAGRHDRAIALFTPIFSDSDRIKRTLSIALSDLLRLAASGPVAPVLAMLQASASAPLFEPLLVALGELAGTPIDAPVEIREVAVHVRNRIENLAETGDPWRVALGDVSIYAEGDRAQAHRHHPDP